MYIVRFSDGENARESTPLCSVLSNLQHAFTHMSTATKPETASEVDAAAPMIEAIGLSKFYGIFAATRDVTFTVNRGELVAFLGPNGAGKSTTMKLLTGYISPSEGMARIAGHNMAEDRLEGSSKLGYLPESGPLYYEMTPRTALNFFASARGMSTEERGDRIHTVVDLCDLHTVFNKPIGKLSKGFKQRVGMAQALLHEPEVLIMDEPTAGLDPNQISGVRDTLAKISEQRTILLSTHILQEVEAMASRVILINKGRLRFDGTVNELRDMGQGAKPLEDAFHKLTELTTD